MHNHIVFFSSGAASTVAAMRVAKRFGTDNLFLLFADTTIEDEDNYRFLKDAHNHIGGKLIWLKDGRDPWAVYYETKWLSHRGIKCSHLLKIKPCQDWVNAQNFAPENTTLHMGIGFEELHRLEAIEKNWSPFKIDLPLCWDEFGWADNVVIFNELHRAGLTPPRLYKMGFAHANCGGFCPKAGLKHYRNLYKEMPERYLEHEQKEQDFLAQHTNPSIGILRQTKGGVTEGRSLRWWREQIDAEPHSQLDFFGEADGGCNCFTE